MCIRDRWYQRRVHGEAILNRKFNLIFVMADPASYGLLKRAVIIITLIFLFFDVQNVLSPQRSTNQSGPQQNVSSNGTNVDQNKTEFYIQQEKKRPGIKQLEGQQPSIFLTAKFSQAVKPLVNQIQEQIGSRYKFIHLTEEEMPQSHQKKILSWGVTVFQVILGIFIGAGDVIFQKLGRNPPQFYLSLIHI
eukprot:TRINITY_DN4959_c0_g2_i14.p1 TRINITY_DN4959_c0_g2~~TRINITY_DN4959_c0_g2_i14.p1  ORF type:complete len:191 (+),score=32.58 TRINITY_DN4959_c0_g2_i14:65-637(+)